MGIEMATFGMTLGQHMHKPYDARSCARFIAYSLEVYRRSGGVCYICGYGKTVDEAMRFDLWRQLSVEHLIGKRGGGYLSAIRETLAKKFPALAEDERERIAKTIDEMNTVSACHWCNSSTSHDHGPRMADLIEMCQTTDELIPLIRARLAEIKDSKQQKAREKLKVWRDSFKTKVLPQWDQESLPRVTPGH